MTTVIIKDKTSSLFSAVRKLTKTAVLVGIPESENARDDGPIGNATIGYLNETGSPSQNIPARPHLVPGIEDAKDQIVKQFRRAAQAAMEGKNTAPGLNGAGQAGATGVQQRITDGPFEPLSPRTLEARKRAGRTGEKPLMDKGDYRSRITYVLREP